MKNRLIFGHHVEKVFNEEKVILANMETGAWIKLSEEVYIIICKITSTEINYKLLKDSFDNDEDHNYIIELLKSLYNMNILCNKDYTPVKDKKLVSIEMTHRCNLKCIHCCMNAEYTMNENSDLKTDELKKIIDKIVKWNPKSIMLSGGEPMLRKDFMELLGYTRQAFNGKIILSTNGTFISRKNVEELSSYVDQFEISIDGIDEETCSLVRGKGVFNKVITNIKLLRGYGVKSINLSMVFSEKNEQYKDKFLELNLSLETNPVCRLFSPTGRGDKNSSFFLNDVSHDAFVPGEYLSDDYCGIFGVCNCSAGKKEIFISHDGSIYPCPNYIKEEFKMGNALDVSLLDERISYKKANTMSDNVYDYDPKNSERCKNCNVKLFCWTCPASIDDFKTKESFNRNCDLLKPVLTKRIWDD